MTRWLVPEVIQTSMLDCGPASLKAMLEGFGVRVSYGRLREACQTSVDGTSIDMLEEVAQMLGVEVTQRVVPIDHVFARGCNALPSIAVVVLPTGVTHFVVLWRTHGAGLVQVMDPGTGRRWMAPSRLIRELYVHELPVPAEDWREYAAGDEFAGVVRAKLRGLGLGGESDALMSRALQDPTARALSTLDAVTRMTDDLVTVGGIARGAEAARMAKGLFEGALAAEDPVDGGPIPDRYWAVRLMRAAPDEPVPVRLRGAVLLAATGLLPHARVDGRAPREAGPPLPPALEAALHEVPAAPLGMLFRMLREDGAVTPAMAVLASVIAVGTTLLETFILRSLFDLSRWLGLGMQRVGALVAVIALMLVAALLEIPLAGMVLRMGRRLEARLRVAFLAKIPRLGDRYFRSRPTSDMTERGHAVQQLRTLPSLGMSLLRALTGLVATTAALAVVAPRSALAAGTVALLSVVWPYLAQRPLAEIDLRFRTFSGSLMQFYLDVLKGLSAVRSHGAERAIRREHEGLLVEWLHTGRAMLRWTVALDGLDAMVGLALAVGLVFQEFSRGHHPAQLLLVAWWAQSLAPLGAEVAQVARQYPDARSVVLRLLEPLGATEESSVSAASTARPSGAAGLSFHGVSVQAAGRTLLDGLDVTFAPGEHVAIVGPSGAGKSSFVGVLLGWHRAAAGEVTVDGVALEGEALSRLRRDTAWVDPQVQLWNRTLLDNLAYGHDEDVLSSLATVVESADLHGVLQRMPDGLQTTLGEGGALVSGGEGQRVRLGRALGNERARLVILDEPFRGLDREKRRTLLKTARARWKDATLLCVTHDVGETLEFPRVLVIDDGKLVEDDAPQALAAQETSRYRALLDAESSLRHELWEAPGWRRLRMDRGALREDAT